MACYVLGAVAVCAGTGTSACGRSGDGFATPEFDDGTSCASSEATNSVVEPGPGGDRSRPCAPPPSSPGSSCRQHPPVGHDLPPFEPDRRLEIDDEAATVIAGWWALGDDVLATMGEPRLWPEHFDIAITVDCPAVSASTSASRRATATSTSRTSMSGPHDVVHARPQTIRYWNAPFGAVLPRHEVGAAPDALAFIQSGFATSRLTYSDIGI